MKSTSDSYSLRSKKYHYKIAAIYAIISVVWILLSDQILLWFFEDSTLLTRMQTVKGWFFVLLSACMLAWLIRHFTRQLVQRESTLFESEQKLKAILNNHFQLTGLISADGKLLMVNETALNLAGVKESEVVGRYMWDTPWWSHSSAVQEKLKMAVSKAAQGEFTRFETEHPDVEGKLHIIDFSLTPLRLGNSQEVNYIIPEGRDITEIKQKESALRESEERFRSIFESTAAPMGIIAPDGTFSQVNQAACRFFGYTEDEFQILNMDEMTHPSDIEKTHDLYEELRAGSQPFADYEKRYLRKDGSTVWGHSTIATVRDTEGNLLYFIALAQDITKRHKAIEALREKEELLSKSQEIAHIGSWQYDIGKNILIWSDETYRIFGMNQREEVTYEIFLDAVHPDDRDAVDDAYSASMQEGSEGYKIEHRIVLRNTEECRFVHEECKHFRDDSGTIIRSVGTVQDVTERKKLMEEYKRAAQLAALGTVAAGVAHEINNPIGGIMNYAALINNTPEKTERVLDFSQRIIKEGERIVRLTKDMLHYSRENKREFVRSDIRELISGAVSLMKTNIAHMGIQIELNLPDRPVIMPVLSQEIQQIVINLIGNSCDAIQNKETKAGEGIVQITGHTEGSDQNSKFILEVEDNGVGIPDHILQKVKDAFFTTKEAGKGTGLGLSIISEIVEKHDGALDIVSQEGQFTKVTVILPIKT